MNNTAIGYARRSTDKQEQSIPDQQAYVEQWAKEHGYVIKRWYVDDAISGTSTKGRDLFAQMIAAAENGRDFDTILCYDITRFSRGGTNETGYYLYRLQAAGVEAIFCADGIPEGDEGQLLQGVKSWQAWQFSVKLSKDSIRGMVSSMMGRHCVQGGAVPFGYDKQHLTSDGRILRTFRCLSDGRKEEYDSTGRLIRVLPQGETIKKAKSDIVRYVPSTDERVAIIRGMFETAAAGYGSRHIAARLNEQGVPSPDGAKWNSSVVRRMIVNPVYRGALVWNKRTSGKLHGVGGDGKVRRRKGNYGQRKNALADWYVVEDVHDPLVPPKLFEEVQRCMDSRRHMGGRAKTGNRAMLSGLIICKHCGWRFGQWNNSAYHRDGTLRRRYRYYMDRGYHMGGKAVCKSTTIPADALDEWVLGKVQGVLLGENGTIAETTDAFVKQVLSGQEKPTDTTATEKELEAVNKRIRALLTMLADASFDGLDELKITLADMKVKRDALVAKLEKAKPTAAALNESDLRAWANERLGQLEKLLANQANIVEARSLIHSVVISIEIDPMAKSGVLFLQQDMGGVFMRSLSTMGTLPDPRETETRVAMPPILATGYQATPWPGLTHRRRLRCREPTCGLLLR